MIKIAAGLLAFFAAVGTAQADELLPLQARNLGLGTVNGVAYYTVGDAGYRVVATLAAGETGTPVRFTATLSAGESVFVSVPRGVDEAALSVEIARLGDAVFVTSSPALTN